MAVHVGENCAAAVMRRAVPQMENSSRGAEYPLRPSFSACRILLLSLLQLGRRLLGARLAGGN
jgi:hypothetical protein